MSKLVRSLVVAGALAAGLGLAPAAQAADLDANQVVSYIDAPMGALRCTTTYVATVQANPNKPKPTYGVLFVNATGTYNYVLFDAGATVGYGICVAI
jgi:hypothetical protein